MAKTKTAKSYETELKKMIESRTGSDFEAWLLPQVRATAANMVMIDKVQAELIDADKLVTMKTGSMKQAISEVNPLMPYYLKLLAELRLQYEALGLNYRATPSKITESAKQGNGNDDPMAEYYRNGK